jgi:hypothetical protein
MVANGGDRVFGLIICPNCYRFTQRYRERCAHCGAVLPGAEALTPADLDPDALVLRGPLFPLVPIGLVLLGLGLFALQVGGASDVTWLLSLGVGVLVLAVATILGPKDKSPRVIIDTRGIEDRQPKGSGFIPWEDVERVFGRSGKGYCLLCARLKAVEPEEEQSRLDRALYHLKRGLGWDNKRTSVVGLDANLSKILFHISRLQDEGKIPSSIDVERHPL